jgi:hypothetical protein
MLTKCRIRHVKCDEGKPNCLKCSTTGRCCDGYEEVSQRQKRKSRSSSPSPLALTKLVSSNIDGDSQEQRGFHFFVARTAAEISGYLPSEFWDTLLLQASHADPAIRHAVIALGSLHEIYDVHTSRCLENGEALDKRHFALQQSSKAISHLSNQLSMPSPPSGEVVLICCLLFICLESFQGDYAAALVHLNSGLRILGSLRRESIDSSKTAMTNFCDRTVMEKALRPLFMNLDLQASTYLNTRPVNYDLVGVGIETLTAPSIPTAFINITEAQESLNNNLHWMLHYEHQAWATLNAAKQTEGADIEGITDVILTAQAEHRVQLERWLQTLNAFLSDYSVKLGSRELRGAVVLKIHHITCRVLLEATTYDHETGFDDLTDEFARVVALSETLSKIPSAMPEAGLRPSYSFDMGILPSLYYTAVRCRDPIIRRKALALLSASPRREGIWDSLVLAAIVRWVIGEEESDLDEVTCAEDVPRSVRIYMVERSLQFEKRRCLIKFLKGQRVEYNGLGNNYDEAWITW